DDDVVNVYVKDRQSGAVLFASRASGASGEPAHAHCGEPSLSDDGRRVAFVCDGPLDPADTNDRDDVYVRDLGSGTTFLASRASGDGPVGDGASFQPSLSADGAYVAFASQAGNLGAPAVGNGIARVFRRELGSARETIVVSRRPAVEGGGPLRGQEPSISDDGDRIAFTMPHGDEPPADPADTNGVNDVYVRAVGSDLTRLVSRASGSGAIGNGRSGHPALAGDGSAVAFESKATNFAFSDDPRDDLDVYRRGFASGTTALVSVNAAGAKGAESREPAIDRTGDIVAFLSEATVLHPDDAGAATDAYVKDVVKNTIEVASRADGATGAVANTGVRSVALSGDGKKAVVALAGAVTPDADPDRDSVILRDLPARDTTLVSRPPGTEPFRNLGGGSSRPQLSADGRFAAFESQSRGLGLPATAKSGVFVRDRVTGAVTLASRNDGPTGAPFGEVSSNLAISGDGRRVAFSAPDGAGRDQVWVRDLPEGRTWLASRNDGPAGAPGDANSFGPALDEDGSRVAFTTTAKGFDPLDPEGNLDVYLRDLTTDDTILVSRADGAGGAPANGFSANPAISADGSRVAFISISTNLGGGNTFNPHVFLRDLDAQTTIVVSRTPDGTLADGSSTAASIDDAGQRVAFDSDAANLGAPGGRRKVFVRDLAANTLVLASRAPGEDGASADDDAFEPAISPDGGHVAFASRAGNLADGA
ncbi:MAG: hypothetical protein M3389_02615, partial [Actinomycetota bacterium]|nr:hypothetical protein [Actinomycetota bacterium]